MTFRLNWNKIRCKGQVYWVSLELIYCAIKMLHKAHLELLSDKYHLRGGVSCTEHKNHQEMRQTRYQTAMTGSPAMFWYIYSIP